MRGPTTRASSWAIAVGLFERYALGNVSAVQLEAETGLAATRIRMILMNPLYNGWIRRHRRSRNETRKPAPWRSTPPVSDELWARVEDVRRAKTQGGGTRKAARVDLLGGLLTCVCGRRLKSDGTFGDGRHRKLHPSPCESWGEQARYGDETWEQPILAQVADIELDDGTVAAIVRALGSAPRPIAIDRARIERQIRDLALDHAAGRRRMPTAWHSRCRTRLLERARQDSNLRPLGPEPNALSTELRARDPRRVDSVAASTPLRPRIIPRRRTEAGHAPPRVRPRGYAAVAALTLGDATR